MEIASQGRVHCSGGCVGCQSSARAAGDETEIYIDRDRHDPAPEILLATTQPPSYRGPTVGMTQSQTLDWWAGENKYEIKLFANGHWIIGSKRQILFTVCMSACKLITLFLLGFVYLPTFCHIPCIMREKVGIQRPYKQIKMQKMSVHERRQGRQKREIHNMKSVECHQFYSV